MDGLPATTTMSYTAALMGIMETYRAKCQIPGFSVEDIPRVYAESLVNDVNNELAAQINITEKLYSFRSYIAIRGEAVVIKVFCASRQKEIAIKIKLPTTPEHTAIDATAAKKFGVLRKWVKAVMVHRSCEQDVDFDHKAPASAIRFNRSAFIQKQLADEITKYPVTGFIPRVYEIAASARSFFTMDYFQANQLLSWCADRGEVDRLILFRNILRFFHDAIHKFGVAHCDIKPENILVRDNFPVLLDFGIAKVLNQEQSKLTLAGTQMGSPPYSPPELLKDALLRDFRVDIFELGILLWIMWRAQEPDFDQLGIVSLENINLSDIYRQDELPLILRPVYARATARDRAQRYPDIKFFIKDFEEALQYFMPKLRPAAAIPRKKIIPCGWENTIKNPELVPVIFHVLKGLDFEFEQPNKEEVLQKEIPQKGNI